MADKLLPRGIYTSPNGKGLRVKIFKRGKLIFDKTWPGNPESRVFVAQVKAKREELLSRLRLGISLHDDEDGIPGAHIFNEAAQEYLDSHDIKPSVRANYKNDLNLYWIPAFNGMLCHEITEKRIKTVLNAKKSGWKAKKNALTPLRGVLDFAGVDPNPALKVKVKPGQKKPIQRYTPKERDKVLERLEGPAKVYFAIAFGCGLRPPSEILALTWDRWDGEYLTVDRGIVRGKLEESTKTYHRRRVYVPPWVRPLINGLPSRFAGEWLFPSQRGGHLGDAETFLKRWAEAHKKAKVPRRNQYTCRHTRAAELLSSGSSRYAEMAAQLGHSLQMFLNIYSELIEEYAPKDNSIFDGVPLKTGAESNK